MTSHRINDFYLGVLLNDSLDAALDGKTFIGPEVIAEWGNALASTMRGMYPDQVEVHEVIPSTSREVLGEVAFHHNCGELLRDILFRPDAFLRSIVVVLRFRGSQKTLGRISLSELH
jgi:hypothetical protein